MVRFTLKVALFLIEFQCGDSDSDSDDGDGNDDGDNGTIVCSLMSSKLIFIMCLPRSPAFNPCAQERES